jgi:transposase
MSRSLTIRKPRAAEIHQLHNLLEGQLKAWQRRRAETILLYTTGMTAVEIAQVVEVHPNTIYSDLRAFDRYGLPCVQQARSKGAPVQISEAQVADICRLADIPPYELGMPYGRWSLAKLRDYLIKHRIVKAISHEHLRRVLKKGGSGFGACDARSSVMILAAAPFWAAFA